MLDERVSHLSASPLCFEVFADANGMIVNPTGGTFEVSFSASDLDPATWTSGVWDVTYTGMYRGQVNPGPGGAALPLGEYFVWTRIIVNSETDIGMRGKLIVE